MIRFKLVVKILRHPDGLESYMGSIKKNYKASRWPVKIIKKLPRASIDSIKILFFSGARGAYL